jgi:membrane protease YdiL (CAAX protease family)
VILFDDRRLYSIAAIELVCGGLAILFLRARGWTRSDLGLRISMPLTIAGMVLLIGANLTLATFYELFRAVTGTDPGLATQPVASASWLAVILILAIDPLYEETFEVAYNLKATESSGAAFGITLSAAIRFLCHVYQGPISALTILPLGLIFAAVYWKWRRVWPLVVAHGVASWFGLAPGQQP